MKKLIIFDTRFTVIGSYADKDLMESSLSGIPKFYVCVKLPSFISSAGQFKSLSLLKSCKICFNNFVTNFDVDLN